MKTAKSSTKTRRSLWIEALLQTPVWRRALILGLPIGLLQAVINQGDFWWHHDVDGAVIAKTIVSPIVTFSVALLSAAATWIERQRTMLTPVESAITQKPFINTDLETRTYDRIEI